MASCRMHPAVMACCAILALSSLLGVSQAAFIEGSAENREWVYLGKFCFEDSSEPDATWGYLNISVVTTQVDLEVLVYDDESWSFPQVESKDCTGRVGDGNTIARVSVTPNSFQEQIIVMPTSQPRFAYVALASKGCTFKVHAPDFKLLFLNPGNDQFGVDEMGLNTMYIIFAVMYSVGLLVWLYGHVRRHFFYPVAVKLFCFTLSCIWFSVLSLAIHYGTYASDGVGSPFMESLGRLFGVLGRFSVFLILASVGSGQGVVQHKFRARKHWPVVLLVGGVVGCYFATLVWYEVGRPAWSTTYMFDSGYGAALSLVCVLLMMWWARSVHALRSQATDDARHSFYTRVGVTGIVACLIVPLCVAVAALVSVYARKRVVFAMQEVLVLAVNAALAYSFFPTSAEGVFLAPAAGDNPDLGLEFLSGSDIVAGVASRSGVPATTTGFVSLDPSDAPDFGTSAEDAQL